VQFHCHNTWGWLDTVQEDVIMLTLTWIAFHPMCLELMMKEIGINPLAAELNPICHLLALLGANHILHISRIRVKCCLYRVVLIVSYL